MFGSGSDAWRHRGFGQSWQSQGRGGSGGDHISGGDGVVLAAVLPGSESDREAVFQVQVAVAEGGGANRGGALESDRGIARLVLSEGMPELLQIVRIC